MSLWYDFDIVQTSLGGDGFDAKKNGGDVPVVTRAFFRSVKTADALRGASPQIRKMFQDAGFDLNPHVSSIAPDKFPPEDAPERARILQALFANIKNEGLQGEYCGEFDLRQFLAHVRRARPAPGVARAAPLRRPRPVPTDSSKRKSVKGRIGFALGLAVVLFALLKYLEAVGATP